MRVHGRQAGHRTCRGAGAFVLLAVVVFAAAAAPAHAADEALDAPPTPPITFAADPGLITAVKTATLRVQIGVPGAVLVVTRGTAAAPTYALLRTVVADTTGTATWTVSPRRNSIYRVDFAGDAVWGAAFAETTVSVRPRLTLTATTPVYEGAKVTFSARARPAHPGATVDVQRLIAGTWTPWRSVKLDAESRATFRWVSDRRGYVAFRLAMTADADHVAGTGAKCVVRVKDPNPYDVPRSEAHFIVVDKSEYRLFYHQYGRIVRVFDCVLGKSSTPTPVGHFKIYAKDSDVGGPYGPRRMRYLGAYAIHGTNEPWLLTRFPRAYSHGCTRLANTNILWLYGRVHVGTRVWNVP